MSFEEVEIPVPWGTIHGKWWGPRDKQPILFLHGWQDNAGTFDPLIPLLPKELSYFCVDFPGHGLSSPFPQGTFYYIFWDGLVTARRIVKHFKWPKVSIVGHSLGGAVGFMYASVYPEEVDKLVSLDIACPRVSQPKTLMKGFPACIDNFLKYENLPPSSQPCYEMEEMLGIAEAGYKGSVGRPGLEILMRRGMKPAAGSTNKFLFSRDVRLKVAGLAMPSLDIVMEMAEKVNCHYLNIRASDGLKMENSEVYPTILDVLKKRCKSFNYHEVEGTHHVHLNEPEKVSSFISSFLLANRNYTSSSSSPTTNGVATSSK
uniref:Putative serine hydrolase n=1 Tax=Lygus hesperus TaxID=30085 RepID=A0A0A9ZHH3_LYGHE